MFRSTMRFTWPTAAVAAALLTLGACNGWYTRPLQEQFTDTRRPTLVRVTLASDSILTLRGPILLGDTLVGTDDAFRIRSVAIRDIRKTEVRQFSVGNTIVFLAGVGVTAILIDALVGGDDRPPPPTTTCGPNDPCWASCPMVYSWNGTNWILDSGTFGGAIAEPFARTDVDNLDHARAQDGVIRLRVANELKETDHLDELQLLVVDHDSSTIVAPDGEGHIVALGGLIPPVKALDYSGASVLRSVTALDGAHWESSLRMRDTTSAADVRDGVVLSFRRPANAQSASLVIDGHNTPWAAQLLGEFVAAHGEETEAWYDSLSQNPELARNLGRALAAEGFLNVSVRAGAAWAAQGLLWEAGPEIIKRQVMRIDLSGVVGDTITIRLESIPSFWMLDRVALDFSPPTPLAITALTATTAVFGSGADVRTQLATRDGDYLSLQPGESAELEFRVPPEVPGRRRSYLLRTAGWYRIHTSSDGAPDRALLGSLTGGPLSLSRAAVARLNQAIVAQQAGAR